jgi:hypothetical protein
MTAPCDDDATRTEPGAVVRNPSHLSGPTLPTWAVQQVGGYLRYSDHSANVATKAAHDPNRTFTVAMLGSAVG